MSEICLRPTTQYVLNFLIKYEINGITEMTPLLREELTIERKVYSTNMTILVNAKLIRRVSNGIFILHPDLYNPIDYEDAIDNWEDSE